jgi:hypothetical protein
LAGFGADQVPGFDGVLRTACKLKHDRNPFPPVPVGCLIGDGNGPMQLSSGQVDNSESGDHLERLRDGETAVVANIPERQGVTGHHVRQILVVGIATVVAAFAITLIHFFT